MSYSLVPDGHFVKTVSTGYQQIMTIVISDQHWTFNFQFLFSAVRISSDKASNLPKRVVRFILLK